MSVLKCKMCGGTIEFEQGATVGECEHCGTKQTLPKTDDDVIANLFNRANNMRLKCEFDKAMSIYEKIVEQDDSEAEAHWGIVLCRYGIEYVEDPTTKKRIPTCHRTLYEAVTTDPDYQAAIDYSDTLQQTIYEKEAKEIDKIQKNILAIVQKEEPFDVFICYKETDENGSRTKDSVIANDIYHQLIQEGFKVFYAAITLEDKLGQEYEPYIFAALTTAKVMLVIGSKPEFFNAVWVKNEWSRYLNLMKTDRTRLLIPCYKDMDAYELPEEFAHLQAQNMGKIGFINDVIRGIGKIIYKDSVNMNNSRREIISEQNGQGKADIKNSISVNVSSLLERAFMFLEDRKFEEADTYCEKALDIEPKNAEAYLGKLLASLQLTCKNDLSRATKTFRDNDNYLKIQKYGDSSLKEELENYQIAAERFKEYQDIRFRIFECDRLTDEEYWTDTMINEEEDPIESQIRFLNDREEDYNQLVKQIKPLIEYIYMAKEDYEKCLEKVKKVRERVQSLTKIQNIKNIINSDIDKVFDDVFAYKIAYKDYLELIDERKKNGEKYKKTISVLNKLYSKGPNYNDKCKEIERLKVERQKLGVLSFGSKKSLDNEIERLISEINSLGIDIDEIKKGIPAEIEVDITSKSEIDSKISQLKRNIDRFEVQCPELERIHAELTETGMINVVDSVDMTDIDKATKYILAMKYLDKSEIELAYFLLYSLNSFQKSDKKSEEIYKKYEDKVSEIKRVFSDLK